MGMDLTPFHGPPAAAPRVPGFAARTLLGFGTHGEVWLADDLSTGGTVALKIGRRAAEEQALASGDPPDRCPEQETALLCQIDHPHIVRLQRVVPLPSGGLAMVLDLASGGSLAAQVAARGRFGPGEVSTVLVPLADALGHLHRQGIVHGDIAPGNVLFTGEGRPQLGDLGAARVLGSRIGNAWSTPGFTDPALTSRGPADVDLRAADVWGLAAVGWFALTGSPPEPGFVGSAATDCASELGELLMQCLTAAPAERPSLPELADRAWQAARPIPVRLVTGHDPEMSDVGLPPLSQRVTRRVPVGSGGVRDAAAPAAEPPSAETDLVGADLVGTDSLGTDSVGTGSVGTGRPGADPVRPGWRSSGSGDGIPQAMDRSATDTWPVGAEHRDDDGSVGVWARTGVTPIRAEKRFRGTVAHRRAAGVAALVAVGTAVAAVGAAVTVRPEARGEAAHGSSDPGQGDRPSISGTVRVGGSVATSPAASAPAVPGGTSADSDSTAELEAELTRALIAIGRSRATAFGRASARFLSGADVTGSPAHTDDVRLVQRLRAQGYRLKGVRYQVSGVQVLGRRGELVDVRAVVTTSAHRQVRVGSGVGVPVPADGPRAVVLTVAPVDLNAPGPGRWRVRSVQVAS
jgi:hypothetical protein